MNVIFVCTGNTCRSPLAEAFARRSAQRRGLDVTFTSAGIGAALGSPANDGAILVGLERGVDLSRHRSRPLLPAAVGPDTVVLVMASGHLAGVHSMVPDARVYLIDEYASHGASVRPVADPYGGDLGDYRAAADAIEEMLDGVLDRLMSERATGTS
ncbi:MAG: low molecular weight protein arginine phosphatase [Gemmatimonadota bacterium]|nr:low molecular weight protein arginine phosphatase [Gemmatimonadota bacterium]